MALASVTSVLGQDTTGNPLNVFISVAGGAVTAIETAVATQSTPAASSTSPASAPASTTSAAPAATSTTAAAAAAAASSGGLSHQTLLDIIIPVVVIGVILLALAALCIYCCLRRRRRSRRTATPVADEEVTTWRRPENPGRTYGPVEAQQIPMSQQPTVPLMAATAERPYTADHPAFRNPNTENPFVPLPPEPRRTAPNSRVGLTDGMVAGAPAFVETPYAGTSRLRKSRSMSRSTSGGGLHDIYGGHNPNYGNTTNVYPNPYPNAGPIGTGLNDPYDKFDNPSQPGNYYNKYGELVVPALEHGNNTYQPHDLSTTTHKPLLPALNTAPTTERDHPPTPFGLTGLNNNPPTPSGPQSPYARIGSPYTDQHVHHLQTDRPSVDLLRTDHPYPGPIPLPTPAQTRSASRRPGYNTPPLVPSRSPNRRSQFHDSTYDSFGSADKAASVESGSGSAESWQTSQMQPPPAAPWEDRERRYSAGSRERRYSGSPRTSGVGTPTNGRRLRFSDVSMEEPGRNVRFSQGVGEAL
ncbi:hypothetical protein MMC17_005763 [Xylographa soralifera]|nr:hypothetical protein [Xylographa soralifera]